MFEGNQYASQPFCGRSRGGWSKHSLSDAEEKESPIRLGHDSSEGRRGIFESSVLHAEYVDAGRMTSCL